MGASASADMHVEADAEVHHELHDWADGSAVAEADEYGQDPCSVASYGYCQAPIADGICNYDCDYPECGHDAGDCCDTSVCPYYARGDGNCDEGCMSEVCQWDYHDCDAQVGCYEATNNHCWYAGDCSNRCDGKTTCDQSLNQCVLPGECAEHLAQVCWDDYATGAYMCDCFSCASGYDCANGFCDTSGSDAVGNKCVSECPPDRHVCEDGRCTERLADCWGPCWSPQFPVRCWDGACVEIASHCSPDPHEAFADPTMDPVAIATDFFEEGDEAAACAFISAVLESPMETVISATGESRPLDDGEIATLQGLFVDYSADAQAAAVANGVVCWDGSTTDDPVNCPAPAGGDEPCPPPNFYCNGKCTPSEEACTLLTTNAGDPAQHPDPCAAVHGVMCPNGDCAGSFDQCPCPAGTIACPGKEHLCVADSALCQEVCQPGKVQCEDGRCVDSYASCGCPAAVPVACPDWGCALTAAQCNVDCGNDDFGLHLYPCWDHSCPDTETHRCPCPPELPHTCPFDGACVSDPMHCWVPAPECAPGCPLDSIGNGVCDESCNVEVCAMDGLDCNPEEQWAQQWELLTGNSDYADYVAAYGPGPMESPAYYGSGSATFDPIFAHLYSENVANLGTVDAFAVDPHYIPPQTEALGHMHGLDNLTDACEQLELMYGNPEEGTVGLYGPGGMMDIGEDVHVWHEMQEVLWDSMEQLGPDTINEMFTGPGPLFGGEPDYTHMDPTEAHPGGFDSAAYDYQESGSQWFDATPPDSFDGAFVDIEHADDYNPCYGAQCTDSQKVPLLDGTDCPAGSHANADRTECQHDTQMNAELFAAMTNVIEAEAEVHQPIVGPTPMDIVDPFFAPAAVAEAISDAAHQGNTGQREVQCFDYNPANTLPWRLSWLDTVGEETDDLAASADAADIQAELVAMAGRVEELPDGLTPAEIVYVEQENAGDASSLLSAAPRYCMYFTPELGNIPQVTITATAVLSVWTRSDGVEMRHFHHPEGCPVDQGCPEGFVGDGICDPFCNNALCEFDHGDCEGLDGELSATGGMSDGMHTGPSPAEALQHGDMMLDAAMMEGLPEGIDGGAQHQEYPMGDPATFDLGLPGTHGAPTYEAFYPPVDPMSCAGRCGQMSEGCFCGCDAACETRGDCCPTLNDYCSPEELADALDHGISPDPSCAYTQGSGDGSSAATISFYGEHAAHDNVRRLSSHRKRARHIAAHRSRVRSHTRKLAALRRRVRRRASVAKPSAASRPVGHGSRNARHLHARGGPTRGAPKKQRRIRGQKMRRLSRRQRRLQEAGMGDFSGDHSADFEASANMHLDMQQSMGYEYPTDLPLVGSLLGMLEDSFHASTGHHSYDDMSLPDQGNDGTLAGVGFTGDVSIQAGYGMDSSIGYEHYLNDAASAGDFNIPSDDSDTTGMAIDFSQLPPPSPTPCPDPMLSYHCWDGQCRASQHDCDCGFMETRCPDNTCAKDPNDCFSCEPPKVHCWDATCVDEPFQCPCPPESPVRCGVGGMCVLAESHCPDDTPTDGSAPSYDEGFSFSFDAAHYATQHAEWENETPANPCASASPFSNGASHMCPDGTCVVEPSACGCYGDRPFRCDDGTCAEMPEYCAPLHTCDPLEVVCDDGSCAAEYHECPGAMEACPPNFVACPDGPEPCAPLIPGGNLCGVGGCPFFPESVVCDPEQACNPFGDFGPFSAECFDLVSDYCSQNGVHGSDNGGASAFDPGCDIYSDNFVAETEAAIDAATDAEAAHVYNAMGGVEAEPKVCEGTTPFLCPDETCAHTPEECGAIPQCTEGFFHCPDGSCKLPESDGNVLCDILPPCGMSMPFDAEAAGVEGAPETTVAYSEHRCPDGSCVPVRFDGTFDCPQQSVCNDPHQIKCPGTAGMCVHDPAYCPMPGAPPVFESDEAAMEYDAAHGDGGMPLTDHLGFPILDGDGEHAIAAALGFAEEMDPPVGNYEPGAASGDAIDYTLFDGAGAGLAAGAEGGPDNYNADPDMVSFGGTDGEEDFIESGGAMDAYHLSAVAAVENQVHHNGILASYAGTNVAIAMGLECHETERRCPDGSCVPRVDGTADGTAAHACPTPPTCADGMVMCEVDHSCHTSVAECPQRVVDGHEVIDCFPDVDCGGGRCAPSIDLCGTQPLCNDPWVPVWCKAIGECVEAAELCPESTTNGHLGFECWDGTLAASASACPPQSVCPPCDDGSCMEMIRCGSDFSCRKTPEECPEYQSTMCPHGTQAWGGGCCAELEEHCLAAAPPACPPGFIFNEADYGCYENLEQAPQQFAMDPAVMLAAEVGFDLIGEATHWGADENFATGDGFEAGQFADHFPGAATVIGELATDLGYDNTFLDEPMPVVTAEFICAAGEYKCIDGSCRASREDCPSPHTCPHADRPHKCVDGTCRASAVDCPMPTDVMCPEDSYRCPGGGCAMADPEHPGYSFCPATPVCHDPYPYLCPDNSCQAGPDDCREMNHCASPGEEVTPEAIMALIKEKAAPYGFLTDATIESWFWGAESSDDVGRNVLVWAANEFEGDEHAASVLYEIACDVEAALKAHHDASMTVQCPDGRCVTDASECGVLMSEPQWDAATSASVGPAGSEIEYDFPAHLVWVATGHVDDFAGASDPEDYMNDHPDEFDYSPLVHCPDPAKPVLCDGRCWVSMAECETAISHEMECTEKVAHALISGGAPDDADLDWVPTDANGDSPLLAEMIEAASFGQPFDHMSACHYAHHNPDIGQDTGAQLLVDAYPDITTFDDHAPEVAGMVPPTGAGHYHYDMSADLDFAAGPDGSVSEHNHPSATHSSEFEAEWDGEFTFAPTGSGGRRRLKALRHPRQARFLRARARHLDELSDADATLANMPLDGPTAEILAEHYVSAYAEELQAEEVLEAVSGELVEGGGGCPEGTFRCCDGSCVDPSTSGVVEVTSDMLSHPDGAIGYLSEVTEQSTFKIMLINAVNPLRAEGGLDFDNLAAGDKIRIGPVCPLCLPTHAEVGVVCPGGATAESEHQCPMQTDIEHDLYMDVYEAQHGEVITNAEHAAGRRLALQRRRQRRLERMQNSGKAHKLIRSHRLRRLQSAGAEGSFAGILDFMSSASMDMFTEAELGGNLDFGTAGLGDSYGTMFANVDGFEVNQVLHHSDPTGGAAGMIIECVDGSFAFSAEECVPPPSCDCKVEPDGSGAFTYICEVRCNDGTCRASESDCPADSVVDPADLCHFPHPFRCADGSCAPDETFCHNAAGCPAAAPFKCHVSGECAVSADACALPDIIASDAAQQYHEATFTEYMGAYTLDLIDAVVEHVIHPDAYIAEHVDPAVYATSVSAIDPHTIEEELSDPPPTFSLDALQNFDVVHHDGTDDPDLDAVFNTQAPATFEQVLGVAGAHEVPPEQAGHHIDMYQAAASDVFAMAVLETVVSAAGVPADSPVDTQLDLAECAQHFRSGGDIDTNPSTDSAVVHEVDAFLSGLTYVCMQLEVAASGDDPLPPADVMSMCADDPSLPECELLRHANAAAEYGVAADTQEWEYTKPADMPMPGFDSTSAGDTSHNGNDFWQGGAIEAAIDTFAGPVADDDIEMSGAVEDLVMSFIGGDPTEPHSRDIIATMAHDPAIYEVACNTMATATGGEISCEALEAVADAGCDALTPHLCDNGDCVRDEWACTAANGCPATEPVLCGGQCAATCNEDVHLIEEGCAFHESADGSCQENILAVVTENGCPASKPVRCNGGCFENEDMCFPTAAGCPAGMITCMDQTCAPIGDCGSAFEPCPTPGRVRCHTGAKAGVCVDTAAQCEFGLEEGSAISGAPAYDDHAELIAPPNTEYVTEAEIEALWEIQDEIEIELEHLENTESAFIAHEASPEAFTCAAGMYQCPGSNDCVADVFDCAPPPSDSDCPAGEVKCASGLCVTHHSLCVEMSHCAINAMVATRVVDAEMGTHAMEEVPGNWATYTCPDGSCAEGPWGCDTLPSHPVGSVACWDGTFVALNSECPPEEDCPAGQVRCADGVCRDATAYAYTEPRGSLDDMQMHEDDGEGGSRRRRRLRRLHEHAAARINRRSLFEESDFTDNLSDEAHEMLLEYAGSDAFAAEFEWQEADVHSPAGEVFDPFCPATHSCLPHAPIQCPNGQCVSRLELCAGPCPAGEFECPDHSCATSLHMCQEPSQGIQPMVVSYSLDDPDAGQYDELPDGTHQPTSERPPTVFPNDEPIDLPAMTAEGEIAATMHFDAGALGGEVPPAHDGVSYLSDPTVDTFNYDHMNDAAGTVHDPFTSSAMASGQTFAALHDESTYFMGMEQDVYLGPAEAQAPGSRARRLVAHRRRRRHLEELQETLTDAGVPLDFSQQHVGCITNVDVVVGTQSVTATHGSGTSVHGYDAHLHSDSGLHHGSMDGEDGEHPARRSRRRRQLSRRQRRRLEELDSAFQHLEEPYVDHSDGWELASTDINMGAANVDGELDETRNPMHATPVHLVAQHAMPGAPAGECITSVDIVEEESACDGEVMMHDGAAYDFNEATDSPQNVYMCLHHNGEEPPITGIVAKAESNGEAIPPSYETVDGDLNAGGTGAAPITLAVEHEGSYAPDDHGPIVEVIAVRAGDEWPVGFEVMQTDLRGFGEAPTGFFNQDAEGLEHLREGDYNNDQPPAADDPDAVFLAVRYSHDEPPVTRIDVATDEACYSPEVWSETHVVWVNHNETMNEDLATVERFRCLTYRTSEEAPGVAISSLQPAVVGNNDDVAHAIPDGYTRTANCLNFNDEHSSPAGDVFLAIERDVSFAVGGTYPRPDEEHQPHFNHACVGPECAAAEAAEAEAERWVAEGHNEDPLHTGLAMASEPNEITLAPVDELQLAQVLRPEHNCVSPDGSECPFWDEPDEGIASVVLNVEVPDYVIAASGGGDEGSLHLHTPMEVTFAGAATDIASGGERTDYTDYCIGAVFTETFNTWQCVGDIEHVADDGAVSGHVSEIPGPVAVIRRVDDVVPPLIHFPRSYKAHVLHSIEEDGVMSKFPERWIADLNDGKMRVGRECCTQDCLPCEEGVMPDHRESKISLFGGANTMFQIVGDYMHADSAFFADSAHWSYQCSSAPLVEGACEGVPDDEVAANSMCTHFAQRHGDFAGYRFVAGAQLVLEPGTAVAAEEDVDGIPAFHWHHEGGPDSNGDGPTDFKLDYWQSADGNAPLLLRIEESGGATHYYRFRDIDVGLNAALDYDHFHPSYGISYAEREHDSFDALCPTDPYQATPEYHIDDVTGHATEVKRPLLPGLTCDAQCAPEDEAAAAAAAAQLDEFFRLLSTANADNQVSPFELGAVSEDLANSGTAQASGGASTTGTSTTGILDTSFSHNYDFDGSEQLNIGEFAMWAMDSNEDGRLNREELGQLMHFTGLSSSAACVDCLFATADRNGDNVVDASEYNMFQPHEEPDGVDPEVAEADLTVEQQGIIDGQANRDANVDAQLHDSFVALDMNHNGIVSEVEVDAARAGMMAHAGLQDDSAAMPPAMDIVGNICAAGASDACTMAQEVMSNGGDYGEEHQPGSVGFTEADYIAAMREELQD